MSDAEIVSSAASRMLEAAERRPWSVADMASFFADAIAYGEARSRVAKGLFPSAMERAREKAFWAVRKAKVGLICRGAGETSVIYVDGVTLSARDGKLLGIEYLPPEVQLSAEESFRAEFRRF